MAPVTVDDHGAGSGGAAHVMINSPTSTTVVPMSVKDFEARRSQVIRSYKERTTKHYEAAPDPHGPAARKQHKPLINEALRDLRQIKRDINHAMSEIRAQTSRADSRAAGKHHSIAGALWGRSAPGRERAEERSVIRRRRDKELEPYRRLKLTIDDDIRRLMNLRDGLATGR